MSSRDRDAWLRYRLAREEEDIAAHPERYDFYGTPIPRKRTRVAVEEELPIVETWAEREEYRS